MPAFYLHGGVCFIQVAQKRKELRVIEEAREDIEHWKRHETDHSALLAAQTEHAVLNLVKRG